MSDLLPPTATDQERALSESVARLGAIDVPLASLWDPQTCPVALLPWLAWALSVDEWDPAWSEQVKRDVLAASIELHQLKGTVYAVRRAITSQGYPDAEIEEGVASTLFYDGTATFNGASAFGAGGGWALFRVVLDLGDEAGIDDAAIELLVRAVERYKPARSHLESIEYRASLLDTALELTDGTASLTITDHVDYNGSYAFDGEIGFHGDQQSVEVMA